MPDRELRSGTVRNASPFLESGWERVSKRQKTGGSHTLFGPVSSALSPPHSIERTKGLRTMDSPTKTMKGRKKFIADFNAMKEASKEGFKVNDLHVRHVKAGEDEGAFECDVVRPNGEPLVSLNCVVSDTSEYPESHTFFCFSQDENPPPHVLRAMEAVHEERSCTIEMLLKNLLSTLARKISVGHEHTEEGSDNDEMEEDYDAYDAYDEHSDDDFGIIATNKIQMNVGCLQRDFNEAAACNYRPGFVPFGRDEFVLTMSLPVISLATDIPARALMAWDRRLLSRTQHLTLIVSGFRGVYPVLQKDGTIFLDALKRAVSLQFRIGLTATQKPSKEHVAEVVRNFGLKEDRAADATDTITLPVSPDPELEDEDVEVEETADASDQYLEDFSEPATETHGFQPFSLSSSLENLLNNYFLKVVQLRLKYELDWASAELLCWEAERSQQPEQVIMKSMGKKMRKAEEEENALSSSYNLPPDPLLTAEDKDHLNLPLIAFCYLIRRLTLCSRYCIVCHNKLSTDYEALKPYVCDSRLCTYQYYNLDRGPSLEYEICANPATIDLLVSLAYTSAAEGSLDEPLPSGMGLRVSLASMGPSSDPDGLCDFDTLSRPQMCSVIVNLMDTLPKVVDMKKHLEKSTEGRRIKPRLKDMDNNITDAAWSILRWCVASCTAHIEELRSEEDRVHNIEPTWRQFRFSVGAPDAEAKFRSALVQAKKVDNNTLKYPSLYAFHGSPLKNWHSIIRHGLWYKNIAHGRAYGNGVYFAKEGTISMSSYASGSPKVWRNSAVRAHKCVVLAEIINQPSRFVSTDPYFVVADTQWIVCRYLLVNSSSGQYNPGSNPLPVSVNPDIPIVPLDPKHPTTLSHHPIKIPEPSYKLEKLLAARREEYMDADYDEDDLSIFCAGETAGSQSQPMDMDDSLKALDDWIHDPAWVKATIEHMMPAPVESSPIATMALQKELKAMLKEQEKAKNLKELGWYMPPELIGDNLFQWIVELHSFDDSLPVAKDMTSRGVNSLVFEIRFPPTFPHSPPFFRILKPRFLPFIHGGGGHVTGGGSMCMDLLTADGWLPSYSISAILLQIRLAISNLEPRPARLAQNWDAPYGMHEALEGYKRAAATHGWKIPQGLDKLAH
ncbi:hypothetical protein BKA93DRAFT_773860 [Sparassis latifolia]